MVCIAMVTTHGRKAGSAERKHVTQPTEGSKFENVAGEHEKTGTIAGGQLRPEETTSPTEATAFWNSPVLTSGRYLLNIKRVYSRRRLFCRA